MGWIPFTIADNRMDWNCKRVGEGGGGEKMCLSGEDIELWNF